MPSPAKADAVPSQRRPRSRKSIAHFPSSEMNADSENTDPLSLPQGPSVKSKSAAKKTRSKSLGPGGLDALQETSGNRRRSSVVLVAPKSILKPTIPLSPLRDIPIRKPQIPDNAPASPTRGPTHSAQSYDQMLEAAIAEDAAKNGGPPAAEKPAPEPEQPAEDTGADERRKRKAEIQKQRDARRKSMANRRVSFAPEATLHTWDTEILQESTTSTGSDSTTRRDSSISKSQEASESAEASLEQRGDPQVAQSPEYQRGAHPKKRRRSSGVPPMNFNDPETLSSSPYSGSSAVDEDETTNSAASPGSVKSPASESGATSGDDTTMQSLEEGGQAKDDDLDNSLLDAAERAGTRTITHDDDGEVSMEIVGDEITTAFKSWMKRGTVAASPHPGRPHGPVADQENINPFSPVSKQIAGSTGSPTPSGAGDDMSMDMTRAVGGIVSKVAPTSTKSTSNRKSMGRRQSLAFRQETVEDADDDSMDFTTAVGGIKPRENEVTDVQDENEELSMEFTSVFGGIKARQANSPQQASKHDSEAHLLDGDGDMEMTQALGGIVPSAKDDVGSHDNEGQTMDFTASVGAVHNEKSSQPTPKVDDTMAVFATSGLRRTPVNKPPKPALSTSVSGSPAVASPAQLGRGGRAGLRSSGTPDKRPQTPSEQMTPQPARPATPSKTPPSANVSMRKNEPKRLFQKETAKADSPAPAATPSLFRSTNGQHTPNVVLAAPRSGSHRRTSGLGIDKDGIGSPNLASILDRRASIGDQAQAFNPEGASRGVRFDDPREMEAEVSREREDDHRRESGRYVLEKEADAANDEDRDATTSLKELMQGMSPKKTKLKGRKSLAVGSGRGLLGKRPAELDDEDASDVDGSPRTFGPASSPVKKIRLQGPLSASKRAGKNPLLAGDGNARPTTPMSTSSPSSKQASTPKSQGRFKNADLLPDAQRSPPVLGQAAPADAERSAREDGDEKIGLQDFLNLTNIRFMELTTTKRRPTMAPAAQQQLEGDVASQQDPEKIFEDSVAAGACTLPMLELFQHSCRELKKYISEGRSIIREIETETLDENPPLFREYLSASPADRAVMDNQFKNIKTNARLQSKETWYRWRMDLLRGIKESLKETARGLDHDENSLGQKESAVEPFIPAALKAHAALEREAADLQKRGEELAACDPEDLEDARGRLQEVTAELTEKATAVEDHQSVLQGFQEQMSAAQNAKRAATAQTKEAQRIREDCRGWTMAEVRSVQSRVDKLVESSGWCITSASGSVLTMSYKDKLQLTFNSAAYQPVASPGASPDLNLSFIARAHKDADPDQPSTVIRFFLQLIRAQLHSLAPAATRPASLLKLVASGWACAASIEQRIAQLALRIGVTSARILGDETLAIETDILLPNVESKVGVAFELHAAVAGTEVGGAVTARVAVVYGEEYREDKMGEFVRKKVAASWEPGREAEWADATAALRDGLVRRGAKS